MIRVNSVKRQSWCKLSFFIYDSLSDDMHNHLTYVRGPDSQDPSISIADANFADGIFLRIMLPVTFLQDFNASSSFNTSN